MSTERAPNQTRLPKEAKMAAKNFTSVAKPLVYDLLSRLNSSFSRVSRNLSTLEQTRIFQSSNHENPFPPCQGTSGGREPSSA
jgi:hypothetical protein